MCTCRTQFELLNKLSCCCVGCIVNFIVSYLICTFQDSVPAGSYNDPFLSSVISMVAPTWCHGAIWGNPLRWVSTVLNSEFTHFNSVIRLSKGNNQPCGLSALLNVPRLRTSQDPSDRFSFCVRSFGTTRNSIFYYCSNFCSVIASCHDTWIRQAHVLQVWFSFLLVLWWGENMLCT